MGGIAGGEEEDIVLHPPAPSTPARLRFSRSNPPDRTDQLPLRLPPIHPPILLHLISSSSTVIQPLLHLPIISSSTTLPGLTLPSPSFPPPTAAHRTTNTEEDDIEINSSAFTTSNATMPSSIAAWAAARLRAEQQGGAQRPAAAAVTRRRAVGYSTPTLLRRVAPNGEGRGSCVERREQPAARRLRGIRRGARGSRSKLATLVGEAAVEGSRRVEKAWRVRRAERVDGRAAGARRMVVSEGVGGRSRAGAHGETTTMERG